MEKKPKVAIVNSSSFGKHFPEHLKRLHEFVEIHRIDVPHDISGDVLAAQLKGINGIIASVTPRFPKSTLEHLPDLVLLARHGIGCDNVDLDAATELGIPVSKVEGMIEQEAVAEHALALLLSVGRYVHRGYSSVRESKWSERAKYLGIELFNKRVGIIGIGNIGSRVAEILQMGFRSQVSAYDPYLSAEEIRARHAIPATLEEIISTSDIISLHCPLTRETARMLNADAFAKMKRGVILINTCRGELLEEDALVEALNKGTVRAYGTDVVEGEPIDGTHRLVSIPNVLVLPHLGGYTDESLRGMGETMVRDTELVFLERKSPGLLANPDVTVRGMRSWA